jgi:hypothetical protein
MQVRITIISASLLGEEEGIMQRRQSERVREEEHKEDDLYFNCVTSKAN